MTLNRLRWCLADLLRPNAWPSTAAQHGVMLEEIKEQYSALQEAAALLETAEQDGYVSEGWREDARSWRSCWADVLL